MSSEDNLTFSVVTPADEKETEELLITKFRAPLGVAINVQNDDMISILSGFLKEALSCPLTVVVRNAEKKIIAVQLVTILNRNDEEDGHDSHGQAPTEKAAKIIKFVTHLEADFWKLVPSDVNRVMKFVVTYVLPEYQRHGIARRMSAMRMDVAKQLGCQGITTTSVNIKSQNLRKSEGFEVIKEIKYKDWLDENGKVIFDIKDGSETAVLTFKRF